MAAWLDILSDAAGRTLVDTGRLEKLVADLSCPESQSPSLVYFAGGDSRVTALQALFPFNNITRRGQAGFVRLHVSTDTARTQHPIFLAEGDLKAGPSSAKNVCLWPTDRFHRYLIASYQKSFLADIQSQIISDFILPWAQVLCLFVDSVTQMERMKKLLQTPRRKVTIGSQLLSSPWQVIVVLNESTDAEADVAVEAMIRSLQHHSQIETTVVDLRDQQMLSPAARFDPLRRTLSTSLQISQDRSSEYGVAFSAAHLVALWERMLQLEVGTPVRPALDWLAIARENHRDTISTDHILSFLTEAAPSGTDTEAHAFIAAALIMHAYPPRMHRKRPHAHVLPFVY